jgi:hypothetical protein
MDTAHQIFSSFGQKNNSFGQKKNRTDLSFPPVKKKTLEIVRDAISGCLLFRKIAIIAERKEPPWKHRFRSKLDLRRHRLDRHSEINTQKFCVEDSGDSGDSGESGGSGDSGGSGADTVVPVTVDSGGDRKMVTVMTVVTVQWRQWYMVTAHAKMYDHHPWQL